MAFSRSIDQTHLQIDEKELVMTPETESTNKTREQRLAESKDMEPVHGVVDVNIPIDVFWECFRRANYWPRWNKCFFCAYNRDLVVGKQLLWAFEPIKPWYLYKLWSIAKIVEVKERTKATWEVTAFPGMYARHTYHVEDLGNGWTRFGSWEKATGKGFNFLKKFWIAHFTFVKNRSLAGARQLEEHYKQTGQLNPETFPKRNYLLFWLTLVGLLLLLLGAIVGIWFYMSFMRLTDVELRPGIYAVFGGGGNSLVVQNGSNVLLIDTKFPPGSKWLHTWLARNGKLPVTKIINTHYHYDHTEGNCLYPDAEKFAHAQVPGLMISWDWDWWQGHRSGIPTHFVPDTGTSLRVGAIDVLVQHAPLAHTSGDLWVYLPQANVVATGDLVFNQYYPFMDQPEGGTTIPGMIDAVRKLAASYPTARFLPGHGPMATAQDLTQYADYLESLSVSVKHAREEHWDERRAVAGIDLTRWHKSILPSFHHGRIIWSTAANNVRWTYRLLEASAR